MDVTRMQTALLTTEPLGPEHLEWLCAMHADKRVMSTCGGTRDREETADWLRAQIEHWERYGFGIWALRDVRTGSLVGRGGLRWTDVAGEHAVEVVYVLSADRWGRGFATDVARLSVETARSLGIGELVAFTLTTNAASERVMLKAGFSFYKVVEVEGQPHVLYRLRG